jgi:hypothetical protein
MNVQTLWLRVLHDGVPVDLVVDVPVASNDGPQRVGRVAARVVPRPRPRQQRVEEESERRGTSETFL